MVSQAIPTVVGMGPGVEAKKLGTNSHITENQ